MTRDQEEALQKTETKAINMCRAQREKLKKTCGEVASAALVDLKEAFDESFKKDFELNPGIAR